MKNMRGKVAAITGAASGIGRALACKLAAEGCHVALADIDKNGLEETAGLLRDSGVKVTTHVKDAGKKNDVYAFAEEAAAQHGHVHMIINNAGVVVMDTLETVSYEDFEWVMNVNLWGVIYGCKAFLPHLRKEQEAHIVNISSLNGIVTNVCNGPYCTTKFAVRGFTETLYQELKDTHIRVSCVHPGGIATNIGRNGRFRRSFNNDLNREESIALFDRFMVHMTAQKAAEIIVAGMKKDKPRIMVGTDAIIIDLMKRLFPVFIEKHMRFDKIPDWMKKKIQTG